ncbi:Uncharacterized conserved protein [Lutibacter oricola]|uniref:Uncharacterized conserved protein n=1 Tax=Lutibacter oricola TaxID=762486 RepID=A0A1H3BEF0_9FLAO|nr:hypothetical protein [Lutibacter oricola]SDX39774.1 Uncharacterized conserved protein [Lutibacter oricola]
MKKLYFLVVFYFLVLVSCDENEEYEYYNLATPVLMDLSEIRASFNLLPPREIEESGKIYTYNYYVFVNDANKGVHIIDNRNPENPKKIGFLNIPGNVDISVKDNKLYANSLVDLVVFDISNIDNIKQVNILKDVFYYYYNIPEGADDVDWSSFNTQESLPVDWVITKEKRLKNETSYYIDDMVFATAEASNVGTGGSLARFKIVEDYLYVVDSHNINVFGIQNLDEPKKLESVHAGFDIETIFNKDDHLFIGSMSGMYIYNISNPSTPTFISEFQHGTACDPVVVDDKYAYITLRAGNLCGAFDSSLQIVNIEDLKNPVLEKSYLMDSPYGLGVKDEKVFICDGDSGLKVYDKSNVQDLKLLNHFENINTYDVIPLASNLLMIGDGVLYQYSYQESGLNLLSTFNLN